MCSAKPVRQRIQVRREVNVTAQQVFDVHCGALCALAESVHPRNRVRRKTLAQCLMRRGRTLHQRAESEVW